MNQVKTLKAGTALFLLVFSFFNVYIYMLQKGLTVDKIEDLVDIIKQDKDFEVERWEFRPKAKALWIYDKKDQQTVVTLKIVDDKIVVNSVW